MDRAPRAIDKAILAIHKELEKPALAVSGSRSRIQLEQFLAILILMKKKLSGDEQILEADAYGYGLGKTIIDSWMEQDSLAVAIISAEQAYASAIRAAKE